MVHRGWRPVHETAHMAGIALRRGRNVDIGFGLRVGKIEGTIVTAGTLANRPDVVHLSRFENREIGVAGITLLCSRNMVRGFSKRIDTVMAV
jgi:hypothetical protein